MTPVIGDRKVAEMIKWGCFPDIIDGEEMMPGIISEVNEGYFLSWRPSARVRRRDAAEGLPIVRMGDEKVTIRKCYQVEGVLPNGRDDRYTVSGGAKWVLRPIAWMTYGVIYIDWGAKSKLDRKPGELWMLQFFCADSAGHYGRVHLDDPIIQAGLSAVYNGYKEMVAVQKALEKLL